MCDTEILTVPPPHSSCWLNQPSYSLLEADCKELNCFHMSSARTEFVAFGNPCCIQLQPLPVCSPPVHACVCVCVLACMSV